DRIAPSPARSDVGALHVIRARHLRNAGWSHKALEEAQLAVPQLDGVARVGAMSLAAALSDDLQLPQQAERHLAMAELAAHESGNQTEVGPLLSLHARTLSRLGFPTEADAALAKGVALLAGDDQRYSADTHRAWIELDRGEARLAERSFASLTDRAADRGPAVLATQLVYWGRALFMTGDAQQALDAIDRAEQLARSSGATAVLFLAALARAEGMAAFERWDDYLAVSETLLDLVLHHLPQWENIARYHRGRALSETGTTSTAQLEIHRAIDACPPGADGWRWRRRCEAARMVIDQAAGQGWNKQEAENLTDELLVSRWFGTAVELMTARAVIENDQELASHAATLADEIGNPLLTAKAVDVADVWSEPASARVADKARALAARLPEGWRDDWEQLPYVVAALARTEEPSEDTPEFREALATAWAGLGLSEGDSPLSPAQRQSTGLVRRAPARLGRRLATVLVGAAAVVALSVGVTFALGGFSDPETVVVEVTVPRATTTLPFVLETNEVPLPADGLAGTFPFRGNSEHTGAVEATGVPDVGGIYWVYPAGDSIGTSPVTYGQWVYFGSNDHNIYAIEQESGRLAWRLPTGGPVQSTPAIGQIDTGDGPMNLLVAGSDDGNVWARDATDPNEGALWTYREIGVPVKTTPLILRVVPQSGEREDYVIVAGGDGYVHAISASGGQNVWRYPAEEAAAPFTGSPTERDGIIYAGDEAGNLHLIDAVTGTEQCVFKASGTISSAPAISDGVVYVGDQGRNLWQIPEGICPSLVSAQPEALGVVLDKEIAVANGFAYYADGSRVTKLELPGGDVVATWSTPDLNEPSAPIIAGDVIYVGSEDFYLYALSLDMEELWRFNTGGLVTTSVAVGDGVIFVTSGSGRLYAIAPRP
ncbi:MAG: PQQ-binding-like beta-propeller repeat protein, partial [Acidimicrobiia bacterium]|nr:PQQ-binding-like beta-propeller repeat protein [Acidimicrobiia bacterium]